ncbi:TRAP transporter small permease subunit [Martelella sp. HB161492]|uniref:TRAP transporter small permease n=1 Tax=Martelella sp. HB161492 TaxID=2720726 RepID=UPI0015914276|nr:TRAP transporter small permease subunit [Martelella sp. HB161492]
MARLTAVYRWFGRRAENLLALLLASLFVAFLLQIVFRYLLNLPVGWTVEWVTIAWLWGILFGYAFVIRETDIIRLDIIYSACPRGMRRAFDVISGGIIAAIFIYSLVPTWDYITFMSIERTAYLRIPFSYVFAIYMPFAFSVIVRSLLMVWAGLSGSGRRHDTEHSAESHDYD